MNDITELESPTRASSHDIEDHADDHKQFNAQAKQLKSLVQKILDTPNVDVAKVERIKQSISRGEYQINSMDIAKKLVNSTEE